MSQPVLLKIDRQKFILHIKRICARNLRNSCKICGECPFREQVLKEMKKLGLKLPSNKKAGK